MSTTKPFVPTKSDDFYENFGEPEKKRRALLIPAAGKGVRFKELSKYYPKCTLPVNGVPIIRHIIEPFAHSGKFDRIVVGVSKQEDIEKIKQALGPMTHAELVEFVNVVPYAKASYVREGPATTIAAMISGALNDDDYDMTIVLSDMTMKHPEYIMNLPFADLVIGVQKDADDYARWCMLRQDDDQLSFSDKPESPVADEGYEHAAVGVYRVTSSDLFRGAFLTFAYGDDYKHEPQFSDVFRVYQRSKKMELYTMSGSEFTDYGTLEEYLENKGINKCRSFNTVREYGDLVYKGSDDYKKVMAEAAWMQNVPDSLRRNVPRVDTVSPLTGSFAMEKIRFNNLRDIALYIDRSYETWKEIFERVEEFIDGCASHRMQLSSYQTNKLAVEEFWGDVYKKTQARYAEIVALGLTDMHKADDDRWLAEVLKPSLERLSKLQGALTWYHGDLHFANMFYCFHYRDFKVVDPRGEMAGSIYYDIAKLAHSVYGSYDYVDAELYRVDYGKVVLYNEGASGIVKAFDEVIFDYFDEETRYDILNLTASLFLSMIPLHQHNERNMKVYYSIYKNLARRARVLSKYSDGTPLEKR